jgi:hypothetical protein
VAAWPRSGSALPQAEVAWQSHRLSFEASLVIGTPLIVAAQGATEVTAAAVHVSTVTGLFGVSALYQRGSCSGVARAV